ncbi:MAG: hypothetical protein V2B18_21435 [Pseudomonadota bacterium]
MVIELIHKWVLIRFIPELTGRATAGRLYEVADQFWSNAKVVRKGSTGTLLQIIMGLVLVGPAVFPAASAFADGGAWRYDRSSMKLLAMNEQRAFITFKDGIQRMALAVNLSEAGSEENRSKDVVWIFPIPGRPDQVKIDIMGFLPEFMGTRDVRSEARSTLLSCAAVTLAVPPLLLPLGFVLAVAVPYYGSYKGGGSYDSHRQAERWGIRAEAVTADSLDGLAAFLKDRKVGVDAPGLKTLSPYFGDQYVFVICWIASRDEVRRKFGDRAGHGAYPSLFIKFPVDRPFFPMRATSAYGEDEFPVSLFVMDWMTPSVSLPGMKVGYHTTWKGAFKHS